MLGVWTWSGSISPTSTRCSHSTMVVLAAMAIRGEKFRAVSRNTQFPQRSAFQARMMA